MVNMKLSLVTILASVSLASAACKGTVNTRKNWLDMNATEQAKYVAAVKLLHTPNAKGVSKLDEIGWMHNVNFANAHQAPHTLPWHRALLRQYEVALQTAANDPTLTIPYWDWSADSQNPGASKVLETFGHDGNKAKGMCVTDGAFANWMIKVDDNGNNAPAHCMTRNFGSASSGMSQLHSFIAPEVLVEAFKETEYDNFRQRIESGGHNHLHNAFSGDMGGGWSPADPIFWLHHGFIDKLWAMWQEKSGKPTAYNATPNMFASRKPAPQPAAVQATDNLSPFNLPVSSLFSTTDNCYIYSNMNVPAIPRVAPKLLQLATAMVNNADLAAARGEENIFAANATHNADTDFLKRPVSASPEFIKKWGMDEETIRNHEALIAKNTRIFNALSTLRGGPVLSSAKAARR
ncbi:hypothetical protein HDU86_008502 [Geranomyces michiganensis]|nr:hypothetical protein HDU86_008502 [Geranomyces michiganensis]